MPIAALPAALGSHSAAGRQVDADAYVDVSAQPKYCNGVNAQGFELRLVDAPMEGGGLAPACIQYCAWSGTDDTQPKTPAVSTVIATPYEEPGKPAVSTLVAKPYVEPPKPAAPTVVAKPFEEPRKHAISTVWPDPISNREGQRCQPSLQNRSKSREGVRF